MRRSFIIGNWKMNGSRAENDQLLASLSEQAANLNGVELAVCVPFVYIAQASESLAASCIAFGAQDVSVHPSGAYTGEISVGMLADFNCHYVIVGHSERRQYHQEGNLLVAKKALAALKGGLTPIVCVGETLEQRESGDTLSVIEQQLSSVQAVLDNDSLSQIVIAYEPVWAIGTGLTASPEQAQEVHEFIRKKLSGAADKVSVLYGGSVKPDNAKALFQQPDIDGALVGGASLDALAFIQIASAV